MTNNDTTQKDLENVNDNVFHIRDENIIGGFDIAPSFLKDNEYILKGYRINFNTFKKVLKSLFILHNESFNIWSHFFGTLLSFIFLLYTFTFIKSHKGLILDKILEFNEEIVEYSKHFVHYQPEIERFGNEDNFEQYVGKIKNQTTEYYLNIEEKILNYHDYLMTLNYEDTYNKFFVIVNEFKTSFIDSIKITRNYILQKSKKLLNNFVRHSFIKENVIFLQSFLESLAKFKEEIIHKIDSKQIEWIDLYKQNHLENEMKHNITKLPLLGMILGALFCLCCSTIYHLFSCHCENTYHILNRIDYAGISILIAGSCYPPYMYFFYCSNFLSTFYVSFITIFAIIVFACSLKDNFNSPQKRTLRGILFLLLGISTSVPLIHITFFSSYTKGIIEVPTLHNWIIGGVFYIMGVCIYMWRFPEKYWPGTFDYGGNSHNIFHLCVIIGVVFHYLGSLDSYYDRLGQVCE